MDADDTYALVKLDSLGMSYTVERRRNYDSDEPWEWIVKTQHDTSFDLLESKSARSLASAINSLFTTIAMIDRRESESIRIEREAKTKWQ